MITISQSIKRALTESGWHEQRNMSQNLVLPANFVLFPIAKEVLVEFYGLRIGYGGAGIDCAKSKIFINPISLDFLYNKIKSFEILMKIKLFPLGELDGGHGYLIIDEEGRTYFLSAMSNNLGPLAPTFSEGLELLILGKRLNRQQIEAGWPDVGNSSLNSRCMIKFNKWGKPYFTATVNED